LYLEPSRVGNLAWQIRGVADFNGDRQPDLLWHNQTTGALYVWFLKGLNATGASFLTPKQLPNSSWQIVPR